MKKPGLIPLLFLIFGIAFLVIGYLSGELEASLFLIFPVLVGSGPLAFFGIMCIFLSILSIFFVIARYYNQPEEIDYGIKNSNNKSKPSIKGGGVILIGPLPIVFGSSWKIAILLLIISLILFFIFFLFGKIV